MKYRKKAHVIKLYNIKNKGDTYMVNGKKQMRYNSQSVPRKTI